VDMAVVMGKVPGHTAAAAVGGRGWRPYLPIRH
jgi:hypothetical protein